MPGRTPLLLRGVWGCVVGTLSPSSTAWGCCRWICLLSKLVTLLFPPSPVLFSLGMCRTAEV